MRYKVGSPGAVAGQYELPIETCRARLRRTLVHVHVGGSIADHDDYASDQTMGEMFVFAQLDHCQSVSSNSKFPYSPPFLYIRCGSGSFALSAVLVRYRDCIQLIVCTTRSLHFLVLP